jgi:hypothetical protein
MREASRLATLVRRLRALPVTRAAWHAGTLTRGQVDAIVANVPVDLVDAFADSEGGLVPRLQGATVQETVGIIRYWAAHADTDGAEPEPPAPSFSIASTLDGRYWLDGDLDPVSGSIVAAAVRTATKEDVDGEPRRLAAHRRADAITDICQFYLDNQNHRRGGRHRPHLNVVIDDLGGRVIDGPMLDSTSVRTLLCDGALHRVVMGTGSAVLDYGTSTRTIAAPLWNALVIRDEHCRFPGCDRPSSWCDGHHVVPFPYGPTSIDNLALMCRRHHRLLHRSGWHAKLKPDGGLHVTNPAGHVFESRPPRAARRLE